MKGVILAGGNGTRLMPLTKVTNKCLLPVYDRPMIHYPIQSLVSSGITDILLVCGGNASGEFLRVLGNGEQFGLRRLNYAYQAEAKGIADALSLAEDFVNEEPMCVVLADNIFEKPFLEVVLNFEKNPKGAVVFGTYVEHPEHYGVIEQDAEGNVVALVEKPKQPKSNLIATGLYMYDSHVWEFIRGLTPSARGELEITDVNNHYLRNNELKVVNLDGWWADSGENIDGYLDTCIKAREIRAVS